MGILQMRKEEHNIVMTFDGRKGTAGAKACNEPYPSGAFS
jgi:hypothetical protein